MPWDPSIFQLKNKTVRKTAAILLAFFWCQILFAQSQFDNVLTRAEQMPYFMGCHDLDGDPAAKRDCSNQELVRFLSRYLVYPEVAKMTGVEGTVYVSFIVDETGRVLNPALLSDIGGGCGQAALDVIEEMPDWEPAMQGGHAVKVRLNLPIQFYLRSAGLDEAERFSLSWGNLRGDTATEAELNEALSHSVFVRGPEGDMRFVDELEFLYEKRGRVVTGTARGAMSTELEKVVERSRKGGTFTIRASVQDQGQFVSVFRSFQVVD